MNEWPNNHQVTPRQDLADSGWGIIFPKGTPPEVREALSPLLELRMKQASRKNERYYRELDYYPGETKRNFLRRHQVEAGPAHPEQLPYYLLIIGEPKVVPYRFQYLLGVQYAVGRLNFCEPEEYRRYADSVVLAEKGEFDIHPEVSFFSVRAQGDDVGRVAEERLIRPLVSELVSEMPEWRIRLIDGQNANKPALRRIMGGGETPALLFSSAHGLRLDKDDPQQLNLQGAIVCQDWPGPGHPLCRDDCFSAEDIGDDACLHGLIAFIFGCYSAGTPSVDNFPPIGWAALRSYPKPFMSRLPQRLLSHPGGGALAVVGHIDRAWSSSFGAGHGPGHLHFKYMVRDLLKGRPIGAAMNWMNTKYAELSAELVDCLNPYKGVLPAEPIDVSKFSASRLWREVNDARNNIVVGDPAVRLATIVPRLKIFLSYAHEDAVAVRKLFRQLNELNMFEIWFDEEDMLPGYELKYEIARAIKGSHVVVLCVSRNALGKSGTIQREIRMALDISKEKPEGFSFIIPVRLERCRMPERLSGKLYVDIFSDKGFGELVKALRDKVKKLEFSS